MKTQKYLIQSYILVYYMGQNVWNHLRQLVIVRQDGRWRVVSQWLSHPVCCSYFPTIQLSITYSKIMNFHQERLEYTQSNGGTEEILLINVSIIDRQNMFQEQEQSIQSNPAESNPWNLILTLGGSFASIFKCFNYLCYCVVLERCNIWIDFHIS